MTVAWIVFQLLACAVVIAWAGYSLSRSADRLAEIYGWGRGWVGLAMLATVTSLPELASGISAVTVVQAPNLAVGNALGACVFNLLFLVVVDLLQRREPLYRHASETHILSAAFGVVMLGFVALNLLVGELLPDVLYIGVFSPLLLGLYLLALRSVHRHERRLLEGLDGIALPPETSSTERRQTWRNFGLSAITVLLAGSALPWVADALAEHAGLSRSFAGTVLMALVTTLPEIAVTLSALRMGALDMALGNLLGSNLFNVLILSIDDAFYVPGPLMAAASPAHMGTIVAAILMTGMVIIGLVMRPQGKVLRLVSWISVGIAAVYALNAIWIFMDASG
ncbi:sodium:calcium antiporter [Brachymonas denitrificans]|uniref:sodium:calcium antiporter n=1 Tax=Brachymonas denitrificans TaxID=28220 RepID=UPI002AFFC40F|nr:sodium:calcium antiporter [Brachymonas denitrificans]